MRLFVRLRPVLLLAAVFGLILPVAATAQVTRVAGVVLGEDGKPVRGASVLALRENAADPTYNTVSDDKGRFTLIGLASGPWWLVVQAPGFEPQRLAIRVRVLGALPIYTLHLQRDPLWTADALQDIDAAVVFRDLERAERFESDGQHHEAIAIYRSLLQKAPMLTTLNQAIARTQASAEASASRGAQRVLFDSSQIVPGSDTFELRVDGKVIGTQTVTLERAGDGFVFRETTATPNHTQTTEVRLGADLRMRSVRQEGRLKDAETRIDVTYADGRASGTARVPGSDGLREITVDARIPANAIDDNVMVSLLPALPWAAGSSWTVPVFASGKGELAEYTFRVGPVESIETSAGTYRTYRAEATGGAQAIVFYVTADAPHQLIKITLPGSPLEIVRTSPVRGAGAK